jgi:hypothetical protein
MIGVLAALCLGLAQDGGTTDPARLVEELGSDDFAERESAEARLRELGAVAREALETARDHEDLEIRSRVRQMLSEAGFLPVDPALRPAVVKLDSEALATLREGVEELLKGAREEALAALKVCAEQGQGRLQFRARQLVDVLTRDSTPPLRYGILVSKPEYGLEEKVAGLEIWVNDSSEALRLKEAGGRPTLEEVQVPSEGDQVVKSIRVLGGGVGRQAKPVPPATLEQGAARVVARDDLTEDLSTPYRVILSTGWGARRPGTYALSSEYQSNAEGVDKTDGEAWKGARRSNRVEFRFR